MKIEAPLLVALMLPDRKARLLLVSSQATPPSSQLSFQGPVANLTDSHKYGYQAGASPNVCPAVWPSGRPLAAFNFLPASRKASQVSGKVLYPTSLAHLNTEA